MRIAKTLTLIIICIVLCSCSTFKEFMGQETPERTALRFTKTFNTEFDRTLRIIMSHLSPTTQDIILAKFKDASISDAEKAVLIAGNTNPNLTEAQKKLINTRKEILVKVKPLISLYVSVVMGGGTPASLDEKKIEQLLEQLLSKI